MTAGENVSPEDLRQVLAEVEEKKPTQRLMVAINYLEDDDLTQKEAAERYGYTGGWLSQWLDRLERLADEPFEQVVYDEPRSDRPADLSDVEHEQFVEAPMNRWRKSVLTRPRGLFRSPASISPKSSALTTATVTSGD
jgi:hypothetical protein